MATSAYPEAEFIYAGTWLMRDTVSIPPQGWARLRFIANNPGTWMLHCHIDWHMSAGLAVILNVALDLITPSFMAIPSNSLQQCDSTIQLDMIAAQDRFASLVASSSSSTGLTSNEKLAVGLTIGLGVPILLLLILYLLCRRGHNNNNKGQSDISVLPTRKPNSLPQSHETELSAVELSHVKEDVTPIA
jgi:hypothetical protein